MPGWKVCEMEGIRGEHEQIERPESLKEEERVTIKNTWAKVYENKKVAGVAVLIRFFTSFPASKQYFSEFQHMKDAQEMQSSMQLQKHAVRVMNALNTLVENLHDGEKIASVLELLTKSHAYKHNVKPVYFKILGGVILEVLGEAFPETFEPEAMRAWSKLMDMVFWHVIRVYSEIGWASTE